MRLACFLRGINISGKNKIPMAELKKLFLCLGYTDVITYLNSGNVIFNSNDNISIIKTSIEEAINKEFSLDIKTSIIDLSSLRNIYNNHPMWWDDNNSGYYHNLIIMIEPFKALDVITNLGDYNPDIENVLEYNNFIYWSFDLKTYQKSKWWKNTASIPVKDMITVRTSKTIKKLLEIS